MAQVIDLDFYRKFRVILPVRTALGEGPQKKLKSASKAQARRYYRRRKLNSHDSSSDNQKTR
ncbi:hypothetical protein Bealeia1_01496 [Candidatus Bealeia paramacronuclearis]|uniref:30S ribosomal protein S21 n=1 Tax=Candidatus Bealeia paramacronuclearis TaxID=1921001 RepID=A0ABZ2C528_9PROT|nr:hypothetical protein [Candidatus Bealeia paramacronuclearis]